MFRHILVPLDGSLRAERAIPVAARIARAGEGMVILLRVVKAKSDDGQEINAGSSFFQAAIQSEWEEAQQYLTCIASSPLLAGLPISVSVLQGSVVASIQAAIHTYQADLLVCCEQPISQKSHHFLSAFIEQLGQHLSIPLFLLPEQEALCDPLTDPKASLTCLVACARLQPEPFLIHPAASLLAALSGQEPGHLRFMPLHSVVSRSTLVRSNHPAPTGGQYLSSRSAVLYKEPQTDEKSEERRMRNKNDVLILGMPLLLEHGDSFQEICTHSRLLVPTPVREH